jgi:hypothetical protein
MIDFSRNSFKKSSRIEGIEGAPEALALWGLRSEGRFFCFKGEVTHDMVDFEKYNYIAKFDDCHVRWQMLGNPLASEFLVSPPSKLPNFPNCLRYAGLYRMIPLYYADIIIFI